MNRTPFLIGGIFLAFAGLLSIIGSLFFPALHDFMSAALPWLCIAVGMACALTVSNDKE